MDLTGNAPAHLHPLAWLIEAPQRSAAAAQGAVCAGVISGACGDDPDTQSDAIVEYEPPSFSPALCAGFFGERDGCHACDEACPHEALSRGATTITISADDCQRCGACVAACPTGALQRRYLPDSELLQALRDAIGAAAAPDPLVTFRCVHESRAHLAIRSRQSGEVELEVPSLHLLSEAHLIGTMALGAGGVQLRPCAKCREERGLDAPRRVVSLASRLLEAWGAPRRYVEIEGEPELESAAAAAAEAETETGQDRMSEGGVDGDGGETLSLRQQRERRQGSAGDASGVIDAWQRHPRWSTPPGVVGRRALVADLAEYFLSWSAQRSRGASVPELGHADDTFGRIAVDTKACTLCGACAVACPTGALGWELGGSLSSWQFDCVACGLCEQACPEHALTLRHELPARLESLRPATLVEGAWVRCPDCGEPVGAVADATAEADAERGPRATSPLVGCQIPGTGRDNLRVAARRSQPDRDFPRIRECSHD